MSQLKKRTKSSINYGLVNNPYGGWLEERKKKTGRRNCCMALAVAIEKKYKLIRNLEDHDKQSY